MVQGGNPASPYKEVIPISNIIIPQNNDLVKHALAYSKSLKWTVFPLVPRNKNPITKNGLLDATKDLNQIQEWWTSYQLANIGIPTGAENGFFVLDVDIKRDKDGIIISNGFQTLEHLTDQYGKLPNTPMQISGSGEGNHYLFKYQQGIKNDVDFLPGLDIRGDGGYIVVEPSIHPSGKEYMWELSSHPSETDIAEAPTWLLQLLSKKEGKPNQKKPSSYWVEIMQGVPDGRRNQTATSLSGHLLRRFVDPLLVMEIVQMWNERNDPPMDVEVVERTVNSIARKELIRRRGGR